MTVIFFLFIPSCQNPICSHKISILFKIYPWPRQWTTSNISKIFFITFLVYISYNQHKLIPNTSNFILYRISYHLYHWQGISSANLDKLLLQIFSPDVEKFGIRFNQVKRIIRRSLEVLQALLRSSWSGQVSRALLDSAHIGWSPTYNMKINDFLTLPITPDKCKTYSLDLFGV